MGRDPERNLTTGGTEVLLSSVRLLRNPSGTNLSLLRDFHAFGRHVLLVGHSGGDR